MAILAIIALFAVLVVGGACALAGPAMTLSAVAAAQMAFAAAATLTLSLKALPALRAGPLGELADDDAAAFVWLCGRTMAGLAAVMAPIAVAALLMGWRPGQNVPLIAAAAAIGVGLGAVIGLYRPAMSFRRSGTSAHRSRPARRAVPRWRRLCGIELSRRERGVPIGLAAAAAWLAALLVGMVEAESRLQGAADAAAALLVFLATLQTLRFDAATVRMLGFEPNSLAGLARDLFGARLAAALAACAVIALVSAPVALFGLALGLGFRALEFLHVIRRHAAARLLAQLEIGLALLIALFAGPAALVWIVARTAWLYRRAGQSMGLA